MVSTPNAPDGLFERIENEPEETCIYKIDLLTNATVIDDAIRFVEQKSIERKESMDNSTIEHDKEGSKEHDYDEDEDQLEEEQEEETGEMTINQVF